MRSVVLGLLLLLSLLPAIAAGQAIESASGTVKSYRLDDCDLLPGTCLGSLVIQSGAETFTFAVARGTYIMHGERYWILLNELRPRDPVTVSFVSREGRRHARLVRLERRPLPGEVGAD